jgi:pyridoxal phosphate enzyme (YggS family)
MDRVTLLNNLENVRKRIARACNHAGRDPAGVTLVAVTKTVDAATVQTLIELGVNDLAENRQQNAADKLPKVPGLQLTDRPRLHFIGPLQRNKVKRVVEMFDVIHSVDSVRLAAEINNRAIELKRSIEVFIEVNVAGEAQKSGVAPEQLSDSLAQIVGLPNLRVLGLMTMAPLSDDPQAARPHFKRLAELAREHKLKGLSMGMSGDFEVALEEGATHVRIGTALFE